MGMNKLEDSKFIPILMYHSISMKNMIPLQSYYNTVTEPAVFKEHMKILYNSGFTTMRLSDIYKRNELLSKETGKRFIITFDDGYRDFLTHAFPVLKKYRFTATVFLPTSYISDEYSEFKGLQCLRWSEINELYRQGIDFGSHTVTHPELQRLSRNDIEREIQESKRHIETRLNNSVKLFSYPFAFPSSRNFRTMVEEILGKAGYTCAVTTEIGRVDTSSFNFFLKRIPVSTYDDEIFLKAKIIGAYDWLYYPQFLYKSIKELGRRVKIPIS
jgi:peptidoglycan/xylan/chitin deacetylase (PgdA/CDA1 family)